MLYSAHLWVCWSKPVLPEPGMAIYSLHHSTIGKGTQERPHTAGAHIGYITRASALTRVEGARMPTAKAEASAFLNAGEDNDRANARVIDKVMLALPRELNGGQRAALVRSFAEDVTRGRAPWLAAFHEDGKDADNPHVHLVVRDRDPETGRRVARLSEKGSTERLRSLWEVHTNRALEAAGHEARIDRRTLEAQGIEREPTIHEGPRAQAMDRRRARPRSKVRRRSNGVGARSRHRDIDYPRIDQGRSRSDFNRTLSERETETDYWSAFAGDSQQRELAALRAIHRPLDGEGSLSVDIHGVAASGGGKIETGKDASVPVHVRQISPATRSGEAGLSFFIKPRTPFQPEPNRRRRVHDIADKPEPAGDAEFKRSTGYHISSIGNNSSKSKGLTMSDDEKRRQALEQARFNRDLAEGGYWNLMERSYINPDAAHRRIEGYRAKHGDEALYGKLDGNARQTAFGRRPGSILSKEGYAQGAEKKRQDSMIARRDLPEAARRYHDAERRYGAAEKAFGPSMPLPAAPQPDRNVQQAPARPPAQQAPRLQQEQQVRQHRDMERPGQPAPAEPAKPREPDLAGMSPAQRQAGQHKLMERDGQPPPAPTRPASYSERAAQRPAPSRDQDLARMQKSREQDKDKGR
jgi:hypothetical protein